MIKLSKARVSYGFVDSKGENVYFCQICKSPFSDVHFTKITSIEQLVQHLNKKHHVAKIGKELECPEEFVSILTENGVI